MDRITIGLDDEASAQLTAAAARSGKSRARWIREVVIRNLAEEEMRSRLDDHERRMTAIERYLGLDTSEHQASGAADRSA